MLRDYLTLTKPKITLLNILTAVSAYLLAGGYGIPLLFLVLVGFLSVGGASALNHYLDRRLDGMMRRTSKRPLVVGKIRPAWKALAVGFSMVGLSSLISIFLLNIPVTIFSLLGVAVYMFYTVILKRRTVWNIVIGGLAGSFAPLAGWAAHAGGVSAPSILLAILVFLWTPGHFWALALRAARDYRSAGIPMLPVVASSLVTGSAIVISNVLSVAVAVALIFFLPSPVSYLLVVMPPSAWLIWESFRLSRNVTADAGWRLFKISSPWLAVVFSAPLLHLLIGI
ncbi:MAG: heme o synthase [Nitrososphaerota archaeon]